MSKQAGLHWLKIAESIIAGVSTGFSMERASVSGQMPAYIAALHRETEANVQHTRSDKDALGMLETYRVRQDCHSVSDLICLIKCAARSVCVA